MAARLAVACTIALITLLGFFEFPGHTYLQADTQIYAPMLEHIWDPTTFPNDLVATKPHLSYTIYDEIVMASRRVAGVPFQYTLMAEQLLLRCLQVLGIYLLVSSFPLPQAMALAATAIVSLGASISGPSVLLFEYEPIPRGFAIALIFLAIGLAARGRFMLASIAGSAAFLYHAPTTIPFWICFSIPVLRHKRWRALTPLAAAAVVILIAARLQPGVVENQHFFFSIGPEFEKLQRMRASYIWVSAWSGSLAWQYGFYWLVSLAAYWRVRPQCGRVFLIGMPLLGLLSVPVSYALLEWLKWGLIPQLQPARSVLFVTAMALILGAAAAIRAAQAKNLIEAVLWFGFVFAIPLKGWAAYLSMRQALLALALAATCAALIRCRRLEMLAAVLCSAYFVIPIVGQVENYPRIENADLQGLAAFARDRTPKSAMFLFADAGHTLQPGIFRARALRAVYVDWKGGGQVNYYKSLGEEWWKRWNQVNALEYRPEKLPELSPLGVNYLVLTGSHVAPGLEPVYRNPSYTVYRLSEPQL